MNPGKMGLYGPWRVLADRRDRQSDAGDPPEKGEEALTRYADHLVKARAEQAGAAEVVNAARASAERSIGLIDATKFGRASLLSIARAQDLDAIVTDADVPAAVADEYRAAGVRLEIANPQEGP